MIWWERGKSVVQLWALTLLAKHAFQIPWSYSPFRRLAWPNRLAPRVPPRHDYAERALPHPTRSLISRRYGCGKGASWTSLLVGMISSAAMYDRRRVHARWKAGLYGEWHRYTDPQPLSIGPFCLTGPFFLISSSSSTALIPFQAL
jgi:hypothetical protein